MAATMRAYVVHAPGRAGLAEVPVPRPGPDDVLLRVERVGLNHLDMFVTEDLRGPGLRPHHYPLVSGCDVAATVAGVGERVTGWREGQQVVVYPGLGCGSCVACHRGEVPRCPRYTIWGEQTWGGLAEYAVVPAANLLAVAGGVDLDVAAAAPVAFTTAWHALVSAGGLRVGETVLIVGAGGGVATAGIAIAAWAGARVLVTSRSAAKVEKAVAAGANAGVDSSTEDVIAWVAAQTVGRGVDVVLDSVGAATWPTSIACLAVGGRLCVCGATSGDRPELSIREIYQAHNRIVGAPMGSRSDFDTVLGHVFAGDLRPTVDSVVPLADVPLALDRLRAGAQFGKVLVTPW